MRTPKYEVGAHVYVTATETKMCEVCRGKGYVEIKAGDEVRLAECPYCYFGRVIDNERIKADKCKVVGVAIGKYRYVDYLLRNKNGAIEVYRESNVFATEKDAIAYGKQSVRTNGNEYEKNI